ncbi:MAG: GIY-YIG nuclease family protein [Gammaproteobacteria bacterium]|nr:GIY-YIG nuclease family protein [Gammaproteobacteria bacterium]
MRKRLAGHLFDASGAEAGEVAIYSLSDPRSLREICYVGQTKAPRQRLLQHLAAARLWLPDELPWWIKSPKLRPLYGWIRQLYRDGGRLPVMVVCEWVARNRALQAERARICDCLEDQAPLLNHEAEVLQRQMLLI